MVYDFTKRAIKCKTGNYERIFRPRSERWQFLRAKVSMTRIASIGYFVSQARSTWQYTTIEIGGSALWIGSVWIAPVYEYLDTILIQVKLKLFLTTWNYTTFFLLRGQKMDFFAPHGEIKSTLWPTSRNKL